MIGRLFNRGTLATWLLIASTAPFVWAAVGGSWWFSWVGAVLAAEAFGVTCYDLGRAAERRRQERP